ncbi:MAG: SLC26A/SulP transporter family protein [Acidobacteria bacterium]|nr:SLC26A/SulP transporter family protein [Acidobacteriota bacterium]
MNIKLPGKADLLGDFWGALAAMLVALPSAIAFGVTIFAPLGGSFSAFGAIAGILGVVALGLIAAGFGGTKKLISAPCAPAAAVLSAFVIEAHGRAADPSDIIIMVTLIVLLAGVIQVTFGLIRLGQLIKYMPYPVVSGYLSGVGLYIIASQVPTFLGMPKGAHFLESMSGFRLWQWPSVVVGAVTIAAMLLAPKVTKAVPSIIIGLLAGVAAYFAIAFFNPAMLSLDQNAFVIGPISAEGGLSEVIFGKLSALRSFNFGVLGALVVPALTLAALLSIDTLKTCVVLDALTHSRHNSNRELIGQGLGNITSALIGGVGGAGTMGATLVNISSGAKTKFSGVLEGILALLAFLALGSLIAWVPIASLAAILIVIGVRMIDTHSFNFLRSRSTVFDFVVIVAVIVVALSVSLITASAVGVVLAIFLFIREQVGTSIIRRKTYGNKVFSKQVRVKAESEILRRKGDCSVLYELQGSLFFGTANQLYGELENDLKTREYLILDMHRVHAVDLTAAHVLEQVKDMLNERNGFLIFSRVPKSLPSGQDVYQYFGEVGLIRESKSVMVFDDIDDALEWVENRIIAEEIYVTEDETPLELHEFELFKGRQRKITDDLKEYVKEVSVKAKERIFSAGDDGQEIFLIRRGAVDITLATNDNESYRISSFGRGNFFGELAFLDGASRSADAFADSDVDLYVLSRSDFEKFATEHETSSIIFLEGLASVLAGRLRLTNIELSALD